MLKQVIGFFFTGLALVLPLMLTIWLIYYAVTSIQGVFDLQSIALGLLITVFIISVIGFIVSSYLGTIIWQRCEMVFLKIPFLGLIYKALKDVTTAFVGTENRFSEPVLVKLTNEDVYKIGFITNKEASKLIQTNHEVLKGQNNLYAVYFPLSFSLSGDLFLVPAHKIFPIESKGKDVMQAIISGGIIKAD